MAVHGKWHSTERGANSAATPRENLAFSKMRSSQRNGCLWHTLYCISRAPDLYRSIWISRDLRMDITKFSDGIVH